MKRLNLTNIIDQYSEPMLWFIFFLLLKKRFWKSWQFKCCNGQNLNLMNKFAFQIGRKSGSNSAVAPLHQNWILTTSNSPDECRKTVQSGKKWNCSMKAYIIDFKLVQFLTCSGRNDSSQINPTPEIVMTPIWRFWIKCLSGQILISWTNSLFREAENRVGKGNFKKSQGARFKTGIEGSCLKRIFVQNFLTTSKCLVFCHSSASFTCRFIAARWNFIKQLILLTFFLKYLHGCTNRWNERLYLVWSRDCYKVFRNNVV